MIRNSKKIIHFENYLKKWGLEGYRFFCIDSPNYLYVYDKKAFSCDVTLFKEILCFDTFIKRSKYITHIELYLGSQHSKPIEFDNTDELKRYALIEKLGLQ